MNKRRKCLVHYTEDNAYIIYKKERIFVDDMIVVKQIDNDNQEIILDYKRYFVKVVQGINDYLIIEEL